MASPILGNSFTRVDRTLAYEYSVTARHAGKSHAVEVDVADSAIKFKETIFQVTGIPLGESAWRSAA